MMGRGAEGGVGAHSSGMTQLQQQQQLQKMSNSRSSNSSSSSSRGLDIYAQAVKALALKSPFGGDEGANAGGGGGGHVGPLVKLPTGADPKRKNRARKTQVVSKKRSFGESEDGNPRLFWSQMDDYFREAGAADLKLLFPRTSLALLDAGHAQDPCFSIPPLGRRYVDVWGEEDRKLNPEPAATTPLKSAAARGIKRKLLTASPVSKKKKAAAPTSDLLTTVVSPPESEEYELCHVCNGGDSDAWNQIVYCDSCNVAVHQECYGAHGLGDGQWMCSWCCHRRSGAELGPFKCVLCPVKTGALKPVACDSSSDSPVKPFAHLFCAQWVPETYVQDSLAMEPIRNVEGVREERWRLLCVICNEKHGACIQCSHGLCATPFHPLCARDAKLWMELSSREDTEDLEVRAYCQKHSAARMGKVSLDDEKTRQSGMSQNANGGENGRVLTSIPEDQTELSRPELIASLKRVTQVLDVTLETVASESDIPLHMLVLWLEGKLPQEDRNFNPRICIWLRKYLSRMENDQKQKNGFSDASTKEKEAGAGNHADCSKNMVSQPSGDIGQVKTNCQMLEAEDEFNDDSLEDRPATRSNEQEELPTSEAAGTKPGGTPDAEPQQDTNECEAYVAPGVLKRLQASDQSSSPAPQQRHSAGLGGVDDQWDQLRQAKSLGVMDWFPQDELEAELFLLQNQLIDCASSNRCLSERLISKVLCQLSKERQAARKQVIDLSAVSQFLADAKEARKQGRREKRDREAQAVLAAATAAAAASPRTGYVKREGLQDDSFVAAAHEFNNHGNLQSPVVRPFRPPVPKPPRLNVPAQVRAHQPVYKNSPLQQQQQLQEEQAACDVCSSSDSMRSNRIIHCSRCNVSVHQDCYGVSRFPAGVWYCQPCSEFQQQQQQFPQPVKVLESSEKVPPGVQCALCPNTCGAFKKSSDGRWVHVFCALWLPKSTFGKEHTSPIGGLDAVPAERLNLVCNICQHQQGACIKCNVSHCCAAFHPICARDAGLYLNVRYIGGKPQYSAYCERHSPQQRAKSADSLSYAALKQYGTPDEISALRQIRVEFERVRLICERICKRERIKRELTQCVKDLYISQLVAVSGGHEVEAYDGNGGASYSDALVEVPWTAESRLTSPGGESIWPVGRGSGVIVKEMTSRRSVLPEPESHKKSKKYNRQHSEPLGREKVMTPSEASMHNKLLPKGYAYVPVDLLDKGKQQEHQQQQQQHMFEKKPQTG